MTWFKFLILKIILGLIIGKYSENGFRIIKFRVRSYRNDNLINIYEITYFIF